jgi:glucose/arabinose dehydrogenase
MHNVFEAAMRCASGDNDMNACSLARQLVLGCMLPMLLSCGGGGSSGGGVEAGVGIGAGTGTGTTHTGTGTSGIGTGTDTAAPQVTLTAPANFAADLTGTLALAATASDDVGVTRVEFEVDGLPAGSVASAPFAASVNSADFAVGQHIVRARAHDGAGNLSAWATATVHFGGSNSVPAGFTRNESYVSGLNSATSLAQASDGRLFIGEQGGALRVFKAGQLLARPFVQLAVDLAIGRGLIGVALHPDFPAKPFVYVHYTSSAGGSHNRISRFTAAGDVADLSGEQILVEFPPLAGETEHNGGAMHFGSDGKLYAGVGDNSNSANSQDLTSPFGKLLRFNDDGSIPADNPFFNTQQGLARAIWAYGLRNPFTFAVQPATGRIHINDVGENTWEEINLGAAGANYGWPNSEGPDMVSAGSVAPLWTYKHSAATPPGSGPGGFFTGFAIAGGAFYPATGTFAAPYRGNYFFADFINKIIGRLDLANDNAAYAFASINDSPVDMLVGNDGALLVLGRAGVTRISAP